jgi:hypothetical protein
MLDTAENQCEYPQPGCQKPGLGFPFARIAAIFSLASGAILDVGIRRYADKGQSELGMLRHSCRTDACCRFAAMRRHRSVIGDALNRLYLRCRAEPWTDDKSMDLDACSPANLEQTQNTLRNVILDKPKCGR